MKQKDIPVHFYGCDPQSEVSRYKDTTRVSFLEGARLTESKESPARWRET